MIGIKRILACAIITLSLNTYAESKKEASQDVTPYEVKSDILNFDYSQMAYPTMKPVVGININGKTAIPGKRLPAPETELENVFTIKDLLDGFVMFGCVLFIMSLAWFIVAVVPIYVVTTVLNIRKAIIERREKKGKPLYSGIDSSGGTISDTIFGTPV